MPSIFHKPSARHASASDDDMPYSPVERQDMTFDDENKPLSGGYNGSSSTDRGHMEGGMGTHELYALNRSLRRNNLLLKVLVGLVAVLLVIRMFFDGRGVYKEWKGEKGKPKTPVPEIGFRRTMFEKNEIYSSRPTPETDKAWDDLLPPGRGFVFVSDWKKYDLPAGEETPWGTIYSVAVFHQMHCLGQLRRFTWLFLDSIVKNDTEVQESVRHMFTKLDHADHLHHCFDYLRQTIQCGGDMSLEWPRTEADGRRFAVDGWGIPHQCRNWDAIMEYMDKNHFNNSMVAEIAPLVGSSG
ncbi:hypothetical protein EJ06DRAFT_549053 [Trichodelitschia bisporula]|uniref:Tat pathway signal sequence n=1 Tax=Trichodelitschia bisporula TaxID=703511 RepID=A0A6G1HW99_9PEZI|nr:hypothetical protein EJ06DRAFT_549053 [Trichodelitschia bisporula]